MGTNVSVAVFGASGFIGSQLLLYLEAANFEVHAFSSRDCDLTDCLSLKKVFMRLPRGTGVVMCATVNRNVEDSFRALSRNLAMAENLKEAISDFDASGLVFLSSIDVYGVTPSLPITETTPLGPNSYYSIAKVGSEQLLQRSNGLPFPVSTVRLAGIYGPGDRRRSIVGKFLQQIVNHEEITMYGDGSVLRDYVDVDDVCYIIGELVTRPRDVTLNVAKGESLTLCKIIEILANAANREVCINVLPENKQAAGDLVFDNSVLRAVCPELVFTDLDTGARRYLEQF